MTLDFVGAAATLRQHITAAGTCCRGCSLHDGRNERGKRGGGRGRERDGEGEERELSGQDMHYPLIFPEPPQMTLPPGD